MYDNDWSINSYKQIYSFNTLEELIKLNNFINNSILTNLMIFYMKDNIKPIWEDENNKNGGSFSYKISNNLLDNVWKNIVFALIGNTLSEDENILKNINGISISPKKNYCIIKLWLTDIINFKNTSIYNFINDSINNKIDLINYDPFNIHKICNIEQQLCIFKLHDSLY